MGSVSFSMGLANGGVKAKQDATLTAENPGAPLVVPLAGAKTNLRINVAVDVSQLKAFEIYCTAACTLYFNDAGTGTPDQTIVLPAATPFGACDGPTVDAVRVIDLLITQDLTDIYVTKAGSGNDEITLMFSQDATP